jgi:hypothetical protein
LFGTSQPSVVGGKAKAIELCEKVQASIRNDKTAARDFWNYSGEGTFWVMRNETL